MEGSMINFEENSENSVSVNCFNIVESVLIFFGNMIM